MSKISLKPKRLPGDISSDKFLSQCLRVNQAGEYGAKRIYEGQLSVEHDQDTKNIIESMKEQELEHLKYFNEKIVKMCVRPSLFFYMWHHGGFWLGKITSYLGANNAMAATEAVEEVITEHYQQQLDMLPESELKDMTKKFLDDEQEHHDIAAALNNNEVSVQVTKLVVRYITTMSVKVAKYL